MPCQAARQLFKSQSSRLVALVCACYSVPYLIVRALIHSPHDILDLITKPGIVVVESSQCVLFLRAV